jgi:hypothetical protein
MGVPKFIRNLLNKYKTNSKQWAWWNGKRLPEDTEIGPGHSYLWLVPWLFPRASEWHDRNWIEVKAGRLSRERWNRTWARIAREEIEEASGWRRLRLKLLFPVARWIMEQFTKDR